jgi:hypothetical protein
MSKVHHTVYKPRYQAYILDTVKDEDGNPLPHRQAKINRLFERFNSEKRWHIEQEGKRVAMVDWLQGIALAIPVYNSDIVELAIAFGSIDDNPSDKLFERVCANYFGFMANIILGMESEVTS